MNEDNKLTTESDWDNNWMNFCPTVISPSNTIIGSSGAFLKTLENRLFLEPNSSVLELGGACSYYLLCLAKFRSMNATIIDYSELGISHSKELFNLNDCSVDTYLGDIFDHDFGNKKFDYIVHWGLIEHFKNPIEIFKLSNKLLSHSGATIFTMPNMEAIGTSLWKKYDTDDYNTHIFHSDEFISELAKQSGFKVHAIYHWGPPILFNAGYWFKEEHFLKTVLNFFVRCLNLISKFLPIFRMGHRKISAHRAFILVKNKY